jgi:hypothetical protein
VLCSSMRALCLLQQRAELGSQVVGYIRGRHNVPHGLACQLGVRSALPTIAVRPGTHG